MEARNLEAQSGTPPAAPKGSFTLTGKVVAEATGAPLPYSTVTIDQIGKERFTDETGTFVYFAVTPGKYKVRIRQLGYTPLDSTLQLSATSATPVFSLVRIPSTLEDVNVSAPVRQCIVPEENGFVGDADLATVLGEARKNAQRERLLRRTYPFEYKLAQSHDTYDTRDSTHNIVYDTITFRSDDIWNYRKGKVISPDRNKIFGEVRVMRLPTLTDLADDRFLLAHCFKYSGVTDDEGVPTHRIDFAPLPEILAPDVEGSLFLDSASYLIKRAEFRLTKGGTIKPAVLGMTVTTTYREILPNVALFDVIKSVQPLPPNAPGEPPPEFRQVQNLLTFRFLYGGPPGSDPMLTKKNALLAPQPPAPPAIQPPQPAAPPAVRPPQPTAPPATRPAPTRRRVKR
ncbi:MAG: carboxypeptidase regulatory-like domain-containing protein [Gemmatimonadales bacterium]